MNASSLGKINIKALPTPCYIVDEIALRKNLEIIDSIQKKTDCKILLALKGFAMFSVFPIIKEYLCGTTASSLDEARLGREEFGGETHVCAAGYSDEHFKEILNYADHIVFNSFSQWQHLKPFVEKSGKKIECSIRINPEKGKSPAEIYNPCGKYSRFGVTLAEFEQHEKELDGITSLHFHALCEQNSDALEPVIAAAEEKFGKYFKKMKSVNFGGGHHISRKDYDVDKLCELISNFKKKYGVEVYLEPGEAIALNTGFLVASVLDIIKNEIDIAILDASAAAHMPDVIEMPYRPQIEGAGKQGEFPHTYRLGGPTCLAGDIIGDYSFPEKLNIGDRIIFHDMAHYTMVKNNTFNGVRLPSIVKCNTQTGKFQVVKKFAYEDYRNRLS
ncbi:MAG: carboxynorspermidine decarboxylase [Verrucomicrobiota bacterium]